MNILNKLNIFVAALSLTGCNSVYHKPNTVEQNSVVYATAGGYGMRRSAKELLEKRGYTVFVGTAKSNTVLTGDADVEIDTVIVPANADYTIKISERKEVFHPLWCVFNGFWWWNFNMSVSNQKTGEEIMTWRGRGCENSSLRKLDHILEEMEI